MDAVAGEGRLAQALVADAVDVVLALNDLPPGRDRPKAPPLGTVTQVVAFVTKGPVAHAIHDPSRPVRVVGRRRPATSVDAVPSIGLAVPTALRPRLGVVTVTAGDPATGTGGAGHDAVATPTVIAA